MLKQLRLGERLALCILAGKGGSSLKLPIDRQNRVIPAETAFMFRIPVIGGFVEEFRCVRKYNKAMRKAFRYQTHINGLQPNSRF